MKLPSGLAFALLFIFIFFMLFKLEVMLVGAHGAGAQILTDAYQLTERMRNEANFEFQLQDRFDDFREQLYQNPSSLLHEGHEPVYLKNLPPHTLGLAISDDKGRLEQFVNLNGQMNREFAENFIEIDYLVSRAQKDIFLGKEYQEKVAHADRLLAEFLGCGADRVGFKQIRASRLSMFESSERIIGLYWDSQTLKSGKRAYFFTRFDLTGMAQAYPLRSFLSVNQKAGLYCAFYDVRNRKFVADRNFSGLQGLPVFSAASNACEEMADSDRVKDSNIVVISSGMLSGIVGRPMFGNGMLPVGIVSAPQANFSGGSSGHGSIVFLSLACLGLFAFVQTFCFGRGMKLTVGRVLILASLAAIFMPFMMGQSVFRLILTEASDSGRLKLERDLHNLVSGIDSGARLFHANLLQHFRSLVVEKSSLASLEGEENEERLFKSQTLMNTDPETASPAQKPFDQHPSLINKLADKMFSPFLEGINLEEDAHRKANAVFIIGPEGFTRFFDRFKNLTFTTGGLPESDPIFLILNLYRRTVERFFAPDSITPGLRFKDQPGRKGELEQFKFEEIKRHVAASVGSEKVYSMLINFEGLNNFRTSMGLVNFALFPVQVDKLIRYFCGISWDEYATSRVYLARVFSSNKRNHENQRIGRKSIFELLDPINYVFGPPAFIQAYGHMRGDMLFSGDHESARLGMLLKAGQRSRRTVKLQIHGQEEALYYVLPGRFFTLYVVGGMQETSFLKKIEEWRALILLLGTILFIVCASLAAVNVSRSVSSPLEHLLWGLSMIEGSDYSVRLRDTREDEFGSISRAFNMMARRLRERDTLGKFVSPAVRKLAGNPELFQAARLGTEADVTILFAALEGFDHFAATAPVEKVQERLEFALEQFYRLAHEAGGEIDKIIGGKLLIVFPHQPGGAKRAAAAAADLSLKILRIFRDDASVKPVFGINAGRVISGIIGAPAVRMDNTVIGDPVNVAARLCSLAESQKMPVVVSEDIVAALGGLYPSARIEIRSIRGKKQEVEVFNLMINAVN